MFWRFFRKPVRIKLDGLIIGLGNPGKEYEFTRHNIGFDVLDFFSKQFCLGAFKKKSNYELSFGELDKFKVALVKPQTYMNNSGEVFRQLSKKYEFELDDIIIVHDDLDLSLGDLRYRKKGSSGGHNGLKSIEKWLETSEYGRMKFGIGRDKAKPVIDFVLSRWNEEEEGVVQESVRRLTVALEVWVKTPGGRELLNSSLKK